jgi:serine/threonine protein phosphatase 1
MARYAITDIHGCARTFRVLVQEQLKLQKSDELYILGDLVNKGPDSKGVIDFVMELQEQHFQVQCLRGNHDQMLLKAAKKGPKALNLTDTEKKLVLQSFEIEKFEDLPKKYRKFFKSLPYHLELPDHYLVHAGFNFAKEDIFSDKDAMLNIRGFTVDWQRLDNKSLLHGHTPTALHSIKKAVVHKNQRLNLDAGCVYYRNASLGNLVALDLDTKELHIQPNLDRPYPVAWKS